jgi:hypothetical protein
MKPAPCVASVLALAIEELAAHGSSPTPGATKTGADSRLAVAFEFHAPPAFKPA